jgi:hypoxanthine phosphoribosyltransferase
MKMEYLGPVEYMHDIWRLAAEVRRSGWKPDWLIGLWRGGAPVAVAMHEFFTVSGWAGIRHNSVKCFSYTGIGESESEVRFECSDEVLASIKPGERVLVADDVFDTGRSAAAAKAKISALGAEVRTASVYWKKSQNMTDAVPDYFVAEKSGDWLCFPHEIDGLSPEQIAAKDPFLAEILK